MILLTYHKSKSGRIFAFVQLISAILTLFYLCVGATYAEDPFAAGNGTKDIGYCGGAVVVKTIDQLPPTRERGPLNIIPYYGSVIIGVNVEPFNIQSGVNDKMEFEINGDPAFTVVLTPGASRSAEDIASDLSNNANFSNHAVAQEHFKNSGTVLIRTMGAQLGSIQLNPVANDAYGELGFSTGYNGPTMDNDQREVVLQAINEWQTMIESMVGLPDPYPIEFALFPFAPNGPLGITFAYCFLTGIPDTSWIHFNGNAAWFVDLTPWEDSEYDPSGYNGPPGYDLLSVARHELGHAAGLFAGTDFDGYLEKTALTADIDEDDTVIPVTSTTYFLSAGHIRIDEEIIAYSSKTPTSFQGAVRDIINPAAHSSGTEVLSGNIFDRTRLNIGTIQFGAHTHGGIHIDDLMNPGIGVQHRRKISPYPSASLLGRAHSFDVAPRFVDGNHTGDEFGSANNPWTTFNQANTNASGRSVIIIPGNYTESPPSYVADAANTYITTRVGSAIISIEGSPQSSNNDGMTKNVSESVEAKEY